MRILLVAILAISLAVLPACKGKQRTQEQVAPGDTTMARPETTVVQPETTVVQPETTKTTEPETTRTGGR